MADGLQLESHLNRDTPPAVAATFAAAVPPEVKEEEGAPPPAVPVPVNDAAQVPHDKLKSESENDASDEASSAAANSSGGLSELDSEAEETQKRIAERMRREREPNKTEKIVETSPKGRFVRFNTKLGSGSYKTVYLAFDNDTGREVAWNVITFSRLSRQERKRIDDEIKIARSLNHPKVLRFVNAWINKKKEEVVFITERVTGGSLRAYINRLATPLRLRVIRSWGRQILEGVLYLHSQPHPVIHRDLKCDNIFVNGNDGSVLIGDLGLSTALDRTSCARSIVGTPEFMAPELYEEKYGPSVDIYAFGMCLLELVARKFPYSECTTAGQIYRKVISGERPQILERVAHLELRAIISDCISKDPENRPTAEDLLANPIWTAVDDNDMPAELTEIAPVRNDDEDREMATWDRDYPSRAETPQPGKPKKKKAPTAATAEDEKLKTTRSRKVAEAASTATAEVRGDHGTDTIERQSSEARNSDSKKSDPRPDSVKQVQRKTSEEARAEVRVMQQQQQQQQNSKETGHLGEQYITDRRVQATSLPGAPVSPRDPVAATEATRGAAAPQVLPSVSDVPLQQQPAKKHETKSVDSKPSEANAISDFVVQSLLTRAPDSLSWDEISQIAPFLGVNEVQNVKLVFEIDLSYSFQRDSPKEKIRELLSDASAASRVSLLSDQLRMAVVSKVLERIQAGLSGSLESAQASRAAAPLLAASQVPSCGEASAVSADTSPALLSRSETQPAAQLQKLYQESRTPLPERGGASLPHLPQHPIRTLLANQRPVLRISSCESILPLSDPKERPDTSTMQGGIDATTAGAAAQGTSSRHPLPLSTYNRDTSLSPDTATAMDVRLLQESLAVVVPHVKLGDFLALGVFDKRTADIVSAFQEYHGLEADGVVGSKTWDILAGAVERKAQKDAERLVMREEAALKAKQELEEKLAQQKAASAAALAQMEKTLWHFDAPQKKTSNTSTVPQQQPQSQQPSSLPPAGLKSKAVAGSGAAAAAPPAAPPPSGPVNHASNAGNTGGGMPLGSGVPGPSAVSEMSASDQALASGMPQQSQQVPPQQHASFSATQQQHQTPKTQHLMGLPLGGHSIPAPLRATAAPTAHPATSGLDLAADPLQVFDSVQKQHHQMQSQQQQAFSCKSAPIGGISGSSGQQQPIPRQDH